ncbi:MAG: hypothetical protein FWH22_09430, partial [Fibromonadales bacterium]|nr:hypothetical protein [Fibromonadales bacterium]
MKEVIRAKESIKPRGLYFLFIALLPTFLFAQNIWNGTADSLWYTNYKEATAYIISTAEELAGLAQLVNNGTQTFQGKTITLGASIVLSGNWTPIGNSNTRPFLGVFDGQNYTISDLSVNNQNYAGLFGHVGEGGQIKNVNVVALEIRANAASGAVVHAGVLAGYYNSEEPIENCSVQADSVAAFASNAQSYSGGLIGRAEKALSIIGSYANANVSSTGTASQNKVVGSGGLIGEAEKALSIINSLSYGNVSAINTASSPYNAPSSSGGLVGKVNSTLVIENSYAAGNISSVVTGSNRDTWSSSGGLTGEATAFTIKNSYATGDVSATASSTNISLRFGGLVGRAGSASTIANSYASGKIGNGDGNGILGVGSGTCASVYYNLESSGNSGCTGAAGLSYAQLKNQSNFTGWDFEKIWYISSLVNDGLPFIQQNIGSIGSIRKAQVERIEPVTYTGSQIKPTPTVILNDTELIAGTDFDYFYGENLNAGAGFVVIVGKTDIYFGSQTVYFEIKRASGTFLDLGILDIPYAPTLAGIPLPDRYFWNEPNTAVEQFGEQTFPAIYTDPSGNYESTGGNITIRVLLGWDDAVDISWYAGNETATSYTIYTAGQLAGLAQLVNNGNDFSGRTISLGAHIALNDTNGWESWDKSAPATTWMAIGTVANPFMGIFDGSAYSISGVYINAETDNQGLFGVVGAGGTVANAGVLASFIRGNSNVGGVAGTNNGTIANSYFTGAVSVETLDGYGGGVAGNNSGTIANSYSTATMKGSGTFMDNRDDQIYKWVIIGSQVWMAENLNYNASGSLCHDNSTSNCDTYGRLYNWNTAMSNAASSNATPSGVQGVCPQGWHLPSDAEWGILVKYVDPNWTSDSWDGNVSGTKLKANSSLWLFGGAGTDDHGFSA